MKIKKELNLVELASEMADVMLKNAANQSNYFDEDIIVERNEFEISYTDEAQDIFNKYYDEIYEYLENKGFKHVND